MKAFGTLVIAFVVTFNVFLAYNDIVENTLDDVVPVAPPAEVPGLHDPIIGRPRSVLPIHITPTRLKRKKRDGTTRYQYYR